MAQPGYPLTASLGKSPGAPIVTPPPWLGRKLDSAIVRQDTPGEKWREEAAFAEDLILFGMTAPHCPCFVEAFPECRDGNALAAEELHAHPGGLGVRHPATHF